MAAPTPTSKRSTAKAQATPESQTHFLYLILKQLDLKTVNWQDVADGIGIKNGHAARMRWSRFKAQTEGLPTQAAKKKRNGEKDVGKESSFKKTAGTGGGIQEAIMDDRETKRVKMEHGYPSAAQMPYPPPPAAWGRHPPGDCMGAPSAPGMHHMIKHEPGMASIKMEPTGELHPHPPFGPWLGPLPPIFAMHGYASNIDPDDLPIKQSQLGVPGTINMADLQIPRAVGELGTNALEMHNGIEAAGSCSTADEHTSCTNAGVDHDRDHQLSATTNQQPSPPMRSIPLHQPGPDPPSPSSTDEARNESAQQPAMQQQPAASPPSYDASQQQAGAFPFATQPHHNVFNMPFAYPYGQAHPMAPRPLRTGQPVHQPAFSFMPPPYGSYHHPPPQLRPSYRGMAPPTYPAFQPGMTINPFDGLGGGVGVDVSPNALQPPPQMHIQAQHALPLGPIPEYLPLGTAAGAGAGAGAGAANCPTTSAAEATGQANGEQSGEDSGTGTGVAKSAMGKRSAQEGDEKGGAGSETGVGGAMPLEPQFVVPCEEGGEASGAAVGDGVEVGA